MPPQIIANVRPGISFSLTADGFEKRPEVASGIASCIAQWSTVETQFGRLFITLAGTNEMVGAEVYASYGNVTSKRAAIKAVSIPLAKRSRDIVDALLVIISSQQKTRDKIAHWFWGFSGDLPDAMVLVDPKTLWRHHGRTHQAYRTGVRSHENMYKLSRLADDEVYIYSAEALRRDAEEFSSLATLVNLVVGLVRLSPDSTEYDERYNELTQDARMKEALSRRLKSGQ